ncbi:MAG: protein kinase domain-containing protein [Fibrobacterota bacterium]
MDHFIGKKVGNYLIKEKIGSGSSASVYLGRHTEMDREAAVKILHPHLMADKESIERFRREAKAIASINNDNIVKIYDFAVREEVSYIIFEYIDGENLSGFFQRYRKFFPPELALLIVKQVCIALQSAHELDIVHRDIKPENIMITSGGEVKLTDFGVARVTGSENMTHTGAIMGSPNYMSPEQIEGKTIRPASDIFSVGALLYYMIFGKPPFDDRNTIRIIRNIVEGRYQSPGHLSERICAETSDIIKSCLQTDVKSRISGLNVLLKRIDSLISCYALRKSEVELRSFMSYPEKYSEEFDTKIIKGLYLYLDSVKDPVKDPLSISAVKKILVLKPEDKKALNFLKRIKSKDNRKGLWIISGVLLLIFAIYLGYSPSLKKDGAEIPIQTGFQGNEKESIGHVIKKEGKSRNAPSPDTVKTENRNRQDNESVTKPTSESNSGNTVSRKATVVNERTPDSADKTIKGYGTFKFFTSPWTKIYIDNKYMGKTPMLGELILPAGRHAVVLRNPPGALEYSDTVLIKADSVIVRKYDLFKSRSRDTAF